MDQQVPAEQREGAGNDDGQADTAGGQGPGPAPGAYAGLFRDRTVGCSICGMRGHNRRTCKRRQQPKCRLCKSPWHDAGHCPRADGLWKPPEETSRRGQRMTKREIAKFKDDRRKSAGEPSREGIIQHEGAGGAEPGWSGARS